MCRFAVSRYTILHSTAYTAFVSGTVLFKGESTTTIGSAGNGGGMMGGMPQNGSMPQDGGMRPGGFDGGMHGSQSGTAATG